jgi:hypothetical protein
MRLPPALAQWLQARGHDAVHAFDLGLHRAADTEIFARANDDGRTIITADLGSGWRSTRKNVDGHPNARMADQKSGEACFPKTIAMSDRVKMAFIILTSYLGNNAPVRIFKSRLPHETEQPATFAVFLPPPRPEPRISAQTVMRQADKSREKTQKQRAAPDDAPSSG